ncbi:hypothetical protein HY479_03225 [Candidatus Uhrbacteria bacterium]|nr:hypothetical protein [Candidatus Uhrbacteria bacterium]
MKCLFGFLAALAWFSFLISWSLFVDPDAFYHARLSLLLWEHGPFYAFPWLDLTTLGSSWADHHFLFHAIEAPFVAWLGWATGARVVTVFLSAVFLLVFSECLRRLGVKRTLPWIVLLAATSPMIVRLLLAKASPLALLLFVAGVTAVWTHRRAAAFWIAILAALAHGGGVYLLCASVLLCFGDLLHRHIVDGLSWRAAFQACLWKEVVAVGAGIAFGLLLHPNFPEILSFLWTQVVSIGVATPFEHVILGQEWQPSGLASFISTFVLWGVAALVGICGIFFASKKPLDRDAARAVTTFTWLVAAFVALTFKSRRNAEYLTPVLAIWIPLIWSLVDPGALLRFFYPAKNAKAGPVAPIILLLLFTAFIQGPLEAREILHTPGYSDDSYAAAMKPVSERAMPGDRMFHSDWDEFPILWNLDDRLKYIAGLDPTFLYKASSTLSDAYRDLTWGATTPTRDQAWDVIHERLESRFIFIAKRDHQILLDVIKSDPRYTLLADTPDAASFEVLQPTTYDLQPPP